MVVVIRAGWGGGKGNSRALASAMAVCGVCIANCQWQIADGTLAGGGRHILGFEPWELSTLSRARTSAN